MICHIFNLVRNIHYEYRQVVIVENIDFNEILISNKSIFGSVWRHLVS